jgi:hypothetical protein
MIYSQEDHPFVERLVDDLRLLEVELSIDLAAMRGDDQPPGELTERMTDGEFAAAVLSRTSVASRWVRDLDALVGQKSREGRWRGIPVVLDDCEPPERLRSPYDTADFSTPGGYEAGFERLVAGLSLDLDLATRGSLPDEWSLSRTLEADRVRAQLYNELGMQIMELADRWSAGPIWALRPEQWRRADDGATYGFDSMDLDLYERSIARMRELEAEHARKEYLFSPRGIVMREAFRLFRNAAALGDTEARWNLGWRYELGEGVAQNHRRAVLFWAQAAYRGHEAAAQKLAELQR